MPIVINHSASGNLTYSGYTDPETIRTMNGTRRLAVVNTNGDVERFGLTTNTTATEYCPLAFRVKNSDGIVTKAYLGRSATMTETQKTTLTHEGTYTTVGAKITGNVLYQKNAGWVTILTYRVTKNNFTVINTQYDEVDEQKYTAVYDREIIENHGNLVLPNEDRETRYYARAHLTFAHVINTQNKYQTVISTDFYTIGTETNIGIVYTCSFNANLTSRFSSYTYTVSTTRQKSTTITEGGKVYFTLSTNFSGAQTNGTPQISFTNNGNKSVDVCLFYHVASWQVTQVNDTRTWVTEVSRLLTGVSSTRPEHFTCAANSFTSITLGNRHASNAYTPTFGIAENKSIVYSKLAPTNPHNSYYNGEQTHTELVTEENFNI